MPGVSMGKTCRLLHATDKAIRVATPDHGDVWIPESCVHADSELYRGVKIGTVGELFVNKVFAEQKEWA